MSKKEKNKSCSCGCGKQAAIYYRNGKYFINKSHWKKIKNKNREDK